MDRLQEKYLKEVVPAMTEKFGYKNIMIAGATHIDGVNFGGTALLIVVGVALDTMKQIESMSASKRRKPRLRKSAALQSSSSRWQNAVISQHVVRPLRVLPMKKS